MLTSETVERGPRRIDGVAGRGDRGARPRLPQRHMAGRPSGERLDPAARGRAASVSARCRPWPAGPRSPTGRWPSTRCATRPPPARCRSTACPAAPASPEPARHRAPDPPSTALSRTPLSIISIVAPAVFGVASVFLFHNVAFLLFAALSPVMAVGTWIEGRRHGQEAAAAVSSSATPTELAAFETRPRRCSRRRARPPRGVFADLAEVLRRATLPSVRLWERRPGHPDFLRLRAGIGTVPWDPPVESRRSPEGAALLADAGGDTSAGRAGRRRRGRHRRRPGAALALARALVCQAAVHHGPADLSVAVFTTPDRGRDVGLGEVVAAHP